MQLLGQQMCEYQTNCWSCRTVSQTAQHCESSIAVKLTAGEPGDGGDRYHVKRTLDFPFLSFRLSAKPKWNSWIYELKPYNSSKTKQRASSGCKREPNSRFSPVPCMQKLLTPPPSSPLQQKQAPPSPPEKRSRDWRLQEDLKRVESVKLLRWTNFTEASVDPAVTRRPPPPRPFLKHFVRRFHMEPYCFLTPLWSALIYYSSSAPSRFHSWSPSSLLWM